MKEENVAVNPAIIDKSTFKLTVTPSYYDTERTISIRKRELEEYFKQKYDKHVFVDGQKIISFFKECRLELLISTNFNGYLDHVTEITWKTAKLRPIEFEQTLFRFDFDLTSLGIGGMKEQFEIIFRRSFTSRLMPLSVRKELGQKHVKGILLYGPPGTGKTLIARQMGKILDAKEVTVCNGPEIYDRYVGGSEEKIRQLFQAAKEDQEIYGQDSPLHVIIFDEIDSICPKRGSRSGTGVSDTVVNQLLTMMDGVDALDNIIIIGMTNRKDMIDPALLRPGRMEVQIEISIPDKNGRLEILKIHTQKMQESGRLKDVDLVDIAERTENFTGAELEGLCKSATSWATSKYVDDLTLKPERAQQIVVETEDFEMALQEIVPMMGQSVKLDDQVIKFDPGFFETIDGFINECSKKQVDLMTVLLEGKKGSGKTTLASYMATLIGFPFVRRISLDQLITCIKKKDFIIETFVDAYRSPLSVIILDDIEKLIEYVKIGPRFNTEILMTLLAYLNKRPPKKCKLLIIGTTSNLEIVRDLDLSICFQEHFSLPLVESIDLELFQSTLELNPERPIVSTETLTTLNEPLPVKRVMYLLKN